MHQEYLQKKNDDDEKDNSRDVIEDLREQIQSLEEDIVFKERRIHKLQESMDMKDRDMEAKLLAANAEIAQLKIFQQRYKVIQKENRELYNMVQDLRGSIRVYCRVRPLGATGDCTGTVVETDEESGDLSVYSSKHNKWNEFKFDRVFGQESTQEEVYRETMPLIRSVLDGYNVCIFAYGQTGSGKTYTMSGDSEHPGINARALQDLFNLQEERSGEEEYTFKVQLLEIYNDTIRDLLLDGEDPTPLKIVSSKGTGSNVPGATQVQVCTADDVHTVLHIGSQNRAVGQTKMNDRSSRSHQVLTIMVEGHNNGAKTLSRGCLHLIDLAGSERISKSGAEGQRLLEAQHINKSLTALGCVMQALAQKRDHIPFRDSKLTQLLQDSLEGQAKSMMFVHIAPEESSSGETLSTCNFGKGVTEITLGAAQKNTVSQNGGSVVLRERLAETERELRELRQKYARLTTQKENVATMLDRSEAVDHQRRGAILTSRNDNASRGTAKIHQRRISGESSLLARTSTKFGESDNFDGASLKEEAMSKSPSVTVVRRRSATTHSKSRDIVRWQ